MIQRSHGLVLAMGAALLTACGGGAPDTDTATEPTPPDAVTETVESTDTPVMDTPETDTPVTAPQDQDSVTGIADPGPDADVDTVDAPVADDPEAETETQDSDPPPVVPVATETPPAETVADTATGPAQMMIVFDGSGSMWGQIDGRSKIEIAREAFGELVSDLPATTPTGLMAYGHRREGDCEDIEVLQSPVPNGGEALQAAADAIVPRGKTPLSASVEQAAELLAFEDTPATVVVITDGIETCDVDPCALGESLEARGVRFTAHIVGFGLSEQEGRQVACLAQETGGRYIQAADAGELSTAMQEVAEAVEAPPEPPVALQTAEILAPETVEIGHSFDVSWTGPDGPTEYDYIDLVEADYDRTSRSLSSDYAANGPPVALRAPAEPGAYKVRYVWLGTGSREVIAEQPIEVVDAEAAIFAPERVGIGNRFELTWRGPDNDNDYVDLVPPDQTSTNRQITYAYTRNGEVLEMTAPGQPGDYILRYVTVGSGGERVLTDVPIVIEPIRTEVAFNPSVELGGTLMVDWTGPDTRNDYIDIVERGFESTNTQLSYRYTRQGNPVELQLPTEPGEYDVRYVLSGTSDGERVLAVAPLELTDTQVSLDFPAEIQVGDTLEVNWMGPAARNDYIDIVERGFSRTNTQITYRYTRDGSPAVLQVPGTPGEYDVRYILSGSDGERVMMTAPLTVADIDVTLTHADTIALGQVLEVVWTGPEGRRDYVDIVEVGQLRTNTQLSYTYTRTGDVLEVTLPAEPGTYELRFVLNAADGERVMTRSSLTVTDVDARLTAPDTVAAGTTPEIQWEGPGGYNDFIDVVPRGKLIPRDSLAYAYTRRGNPVALLMPDEPGDYDLRYIHVGSDERVIKARREITVE